MTRYRRDRCGVQRPDIVVIQVSSGCSGLISNQAVKFGVGVLGNPYVGDRLPSHERTNIMDQDNQVQLFIPFFERVVICQVSLHSFTLGEVGEVEMVAGLGKEVVVMDGGQAF